MKGFLCVLLVVACFGLVCLAPEFVFAQSGGSGFTAESVTFTNLVDFDGTNGVLSQIKAPLAKILAGALGIGLAVWAARFFFRVVKSMGRG
jgi:hypothetical protein